MGEKGERKVDFLSQFGEHTVMNPPTGMSMINSGLMKKVDAFLASIFLATVITFRRPDCIANVQLSRRRRGIEVLKNSGKLGQNGISQPPPPAPPHTRYRPAFKDLQGLSTFKLDLRRFLGFCIP